MSAAMPSVTMPLADQDARDRIRNDLDTTLIIEAAAGTGKTTALVERIVAVIASGRAELARVVAVTFTEKAAGEMRLRLRTAIEQARQDAGLDEAARNRMAVALEQLEEARIGTIHSFCADLLRERPVQARVDPRFEVAAEDSADSLFEAAFERWFEQALASPGEGLRRILRRREFAEREGPRPALRSAAFELLQWRDFHAPWARQEFQRDREIDSLLAEVSSLGALSALGESEDPLTRSLDGIRRTIDEAVRLESVSGRDYDALEAMLVRLLRGPQGRWTWRGWGEHYGPLERAEVLRQRDGIKQRLEAFSHAAGANLAPLLREELWPIVGIYDQMKRRAGVLDFLDLLLIARDLVRDNRAVRTELQHRFTHIFIDEFQDTDPLQAEILLLLAADDPSQSDWLGVRPAPGKLFIVGDPKQSIYRFRRADVALYQAVKQQLLAHGAALKHLTVSFRSIPAIQRMINGVFAPLMAEESPTRPHYAPLEPFRPDCESQPATVALPVPAPYNQYGRITKWQIDESLPDAVGAFVDWLLRDSGWTVTERENPSARVPILPRHICILFRRFNSYRRDVTRSYVRALEARHIPHVLIKGGSFHEREEVEAIRNALTAIERPDDELAVFATLHGPLFALMDGALLEFRETLGSLHPFRPLPDGLTGDLAEVGRALDVLRDLHRGRNRRPIAQTIAQLLSATRAHAGVAIWPTGEQALANIMRLMDLARRYEGRSGAVSFRGFVEELHDRAGREQAGDSPVIEDAAEGVRIMTVHRAKGLEFPVVILADITCNETGSEASRFVDPERRLCALRLAGCLPQELLDHADEELERDREEAARLLYVATTRARDLVVVPVVGDQEQDGWLGKLNPALYPSNDKRRLPLDRRPPGCPQFGEDSVRVRPPKAAARARPVVPGLHRIQANTAVEAAQAHQVVWWDPSQLVLDVRETMGLRQSKLLEADESRIVSRRGSEEHQDWQSHRAAMLARGGKPEMKVATVTQLAEQMPGLVNGFEIEIEQKPQVANRPYSARFGTLVHGALMRVPFEAEAGEIRASVEFFGRMLGAEQAEMLAATEAVHSALGSKVIAQARVASGPLMRECALSVYLKPDEALEASADGVLGEAQRGGPQTSSESSAAGEEDGGTLAEGVADLVFLERNGGEPRWVVVDFKTDFDLNRRLEEYRRQLGLYLRAISTSSGYPARGVLLWI